MKMTNVQHLECGNRVSTTTSFRIFPTKIIDGRILLILRAYLRTKTAYMVMENIAVFYIRSNRHTLPKQLTDSMQLKKMTSSSLI